MLEHVPHWLGAALSGVRAGAERLTVLRPELAGAPASVSLRSTGFADGGELPGRYTADGPGPSPPLFWTGVPEGTAELALIVEDADSPSPQPLVHAIVVGLDGRDGSLAEGAIGGDEAAVDTGRTSYFTEGWLPPDPPTGHGEHRYAFQLFALAAPTGLSGAPGRAALVEAMAGKVLAVGVLTGTYSRDRRAAAVGPAGAGAAAR